MTDTLARYIMFGAIIFALALGLLSQVCHDGCDPTDTRCHSMAVQECASDGDWYEVENCAEIGPGVWECCESALIWNGEETADCVPAGECDGGLE